MSVKDEEMLRPMVEMSRLLFPVSVSASHDHSGNGAALVKIQYIASWGEIYNITLTLPPRPDET